MTTLSSNELISKVRGSDLPYEDGIPLESSWHLDAMYLLISILRYFWRDRSDIYIAGNMFVYFDPDQDKRRNFRGPDFFVVKGVKDNSPRKSWVIWEEEGLTPDFVIELASESTVRFDLTGKKDIYEQTLKTPEYVVYNPETEELRGWRLASGQYEAIRPNERGWLWCNELGLWLGTADYQFIEQTAPTKTLRFFDDQSRLILTKTEAGEERAKAEGQRAEVEARRAETERRRAEIEARRAEAETQRAAAEAEARRAAEAEVARLKALLEEKD